MTNTASTNILTLFGLGYVRFSASLASVLAVLLYLIPWLLAPKFAPIITVGILLLTILFTLREVPKFASQLCLDPPQFVIDEFIGMYVCLTLISTSDFGNIFILLAVFRALDIFKPEPFAGIELQYHGPFGFIVDDVVIALFMVALWWIPQLL
jgi:phosphatidylglycerophosphatase A